MTETTMNAMVELDEAAIRAGGYVLPPWKRQTKREDEEIFTRIRNYCVMNNKSTDKLTQEELNMLGYHRVTPNA